MAGKQRVKKLAPRLKNRPRVISHLTKWPNRAHSRDRDNDGIVHSLASRSNPTISTAVFVVQLDIESKNLNVMCDAYLLLILFLHSLLASVESCSCCVKNLWQSSHMGWRGVGHKGEDWGMSTKIISGQVLSHFLFLGLRRYILSPTC